MLNNNVVRPSESPWNAPLVLVRKKDGSIRFCVDYSRLNAITIRQVHQFPRIPEMISRLRDARVFSTLDAASGYWQIQLEESAKPFTAFTVPRLGHFEFNVMPFGLKNAPAVFQRAMDFALSGLDPLFCMIYIDDILVHSSTPEQHLLDLERLFDRLASFNIVINPTKCRLFREELPFLGFVVSGEEFGRTTARSRRSPTALRRGTSLNCATFLDCSPTTALTFPTRPTYSSL